MRKYAENYKYAENNKLLKNGKLCDPAPIAPNRCLWWNPCLQPGLHCRSCDVKVYTRLIYLISRMTLSCESMKSPYSSNIPAARVPSKLIVLRGAKQITLHVILLVLSPIHLCHISGTKPSIKPLTTGRFL